MEGAIIGSVVTIILAILGSSWRLSGQIKGVDSRLTSLTERLDRVDVEGLRDRVSRLEERTLATERQCEARHRQ